MPKTAQPTAWVFKLRARSWSRKDGWLTRIAHHPAWVRIGPGSRCSSDPCPGSGGRRVRPSAVASRDPPFHTLVPSSRQAFEWSCSDSGAGTHRAERPGNGPDIESPGNPRQRGLNSWPPLITAKSSARRQSSTPHLSCSEKTGFPWESTISSHPKEPTASTPF